MVVNSDESIALLVEQRGNLVVSKQVWKWYMTSSSKLPDDDNTVPCITSKEAGAVVVDAWLPYAAQGRAKVSTVTESDTAPIR